MIADWRAAGAPDRGGQAGRVLRPLLARPQWSGAARLQSRQLQPVCYRDGHSTFQPLKSNLQQMLIRIKYFI